MRNKKLNEDYQLNIDEKGLPVLETPYQMTYRIKDGKYQITSVHPYDDTDYGFALSETENIDGNWVVYDANDEYSTYMDISNRPSQYILVDKVTGWNSALELLKKIDSRKSTRKVEDITQVSDVNGGRVDIFSINNYNRDILDDVNANLLESLHQLDDYTLLDDADVMNQYKSILDILSIAQDDITYDTYRYNSLTNTQLNELVDKAPAFVDMEMRQNGGPTLEAIISFANKNPDFIYEGYLVTPPREDYRITIDGIKAVNNDENTLKLMRFISDWDSPDEFGEYKGYIRAWWD